MSVMPTAILCARSFRDMTENKYAAYIADETDAMVTNGSLDDSRLLTSMYYFVKHAKFLRPYIAASSTQLEGRYLSQNQAVEEFQPDGILEVAAGLTPRPIEFNFRYPDMPHVESDLEGMITAKKHIVHKLLYPSEIHKDMHFTTVDVMDYNSLVMAGRLLSGGKIAVLQQGLLGYFSLREQTVIRDNMARFLKEYTEGGAWITPDFSFNAKRFNPVVKLLRNIIHIAARKKGYNHSSLYEAKQFLNEGGLEAREFDNTGAILRTYVARSGAVPAEKLIKQGEGYRPLIITANN